MKKVTNISIGPRGLFDAAGALVMIEPGKSANVDLADGDVSKEWFSLDRADEEAPEPEANDIASAIDLLDPKDDKHWTNAGLPAVDAVSALVGRTVTRAEINAAAPDFMRPAAE